MKVAIQIVLYKSSKDLPTVLQSLKNQTFTDWKVFAKENSCDQHEAQRAKEILDQSSIAYDLVVSETNRGFSSHNDLYRMQDAEFVLVLNDDAYLEPDFLRILVERMQTDPSCGSCGGVVFRWTMPGDQKQILSDETRIDTMGLEYRCLANVVDWNAGKTFQEVKTQMDQPRQIFGISGSIALYRRTAVDSVSPDGNLYDPTFFMYKEDVELALRLKRKGWTAWLEPSAQAFHRRAIKTEAKTALDRLREERKRPAHLRIQTFRNQIVVLLIHVSWSLGARDLLRSLLHHTKYKVFVFTASPNVFFQAYWKAILSFPYALKRRHELKNYVA